jgi:CBS domain-containing protein
MKASDVMVRDVITVHSDTPVEKIAETLLANRISAVPVVDAAGTMVGIVSEGDLIHRVEAGTDVHRSWWLEILVDKESLAREFVKSHARKAADVMTRYVISVTPDAMLGDIASLLEKHKIKRVPVVDGNGRIVGIVSRANLVQALVRMSTMKAAAAPVDDTVLHDNILAQLRSQPWTDASNLNIIVNNGSVELWGIVESEAEKNAVRVVVEVTPGVREVFNKIAVDRIPTGQ